MPKVIKVNDKSAINHLYRQGWSIRRISRELNFNRRTVRKYLENGSKNGKCTNMITGSDSVSDLKCTNMITGSDSVSSLSVKPKIYGRRSCCEPLHDVIVQKFHQGLNAQRIHQDLKMDYGFTSSDQTVRRYVRKLKEVHQLPVRVMHSLPGEEAQVDFGQGAPIMQENGRKKKPHLFRIVLSHSRKAYSEVVYSQKTENFLRALENAFRYFGGVPKTIVTDNLKAAVIHADWYDPEINPKLRSFANHYGTVILPTRPRKPEHKGKIENGIKYCQDNALKGRVFQSLHEQNKFLKKWERTIADTRIHGTTQVQVEALFQEEKDTLGRLPFNVFELFTEGKRSVQRHGHVEVTRSFYSVPPEFLGHHVWVRYDEKIVRIYDLKMNQIAIHTRLPKGRYSTLKKHIPNEKINAGEYGTDYLLRKLNGIGSECAIWGEVMLANRGLQGVRVLQGLISLKKKYSREQLCKTALVAIKGECFNLKDFKQLLELKHDQLQFDLTDVHPLIRKMGDYASMSPNVFDPVELEERR